MQTNDDVFEIEVQTDEIDYLTRWTQFPPEDSKGYGTDDPFNRGETDDDILEKFRLEVNVNDLQQFMTRASKVKVQFVSLFLVLIIINYNRKLSR